MGERGVTVIQLTFSLRDGDLMHVRTFCLFARKKFSAYNERDILVSCFLVLGPLLKIGREGSIFGWKLLFRLWPKSFGFVKNWILVLLETFNLLAFMVSWCCKLVHLIAERKLQYS